MKRVVLSVIIVFMCMLINAQVPEYINYQAIVRNDGEVLSGQPVYYLFTILKGELPGEVIYTEKHSTGTNQFGLVTLAIGNGTNTTGNFTSIDWGTGTYFLKVEIDLEGDGTYIDMGTIQLLSVPYAMYSKKAGAATETDPIFSVSPANGIIGTDITNWNAAYGWGNHSLIGYVPGTRILTVNGTALDLSDNRSWSVGTVTSVGLTLPGIFTVSGSPVTASGTLDASLASQTTNLVFASPDGGPGTPSFRALVAPDVPNLDWSKITSGKPTTLVGYGITDGVNTTGNQTIDGNKTFSGTTTVPTPVNATDAATKAYVDAILSQLSAKGAIVADADGNIYSTVRIGSQVWMGENLKTTRYKDGTDIPLITDNTDWSNLLTPGYCWYNNDAATYKATYGAIYNWFTVNTGNLCPSGWHVPADAELTTLENYMIANGYNYDGSTTGNKIAKALASTTLWTSSAIAGAVGNTDYPTKRNVTGFTALPGGFRNYDGLFTEVGGSDYWWSASEFNATNAICRTLWPYNVTLVSGNWKKKDGFSVRCIKD